jgi:tryptophan synthase alpha chain
MIANSPVSTLFARAKEGGRPALIAYIVAGDPDLATTERVIWALGEAGVDLIELGIPYGDPLADGPTIAAAAFRALSAGVRIGDVLALAGRVSRAGGPPLLFFTYANPVDRYGNARFAQDAAASGAAGAIVPDIPLEESLALRDELTERGLVLPLLVAPTTPLERAERIVRASTGFVYVVSRLGVTGAGRRPDLSATAGRVAELRAFGELPLAVGFGISTPHDVRAVAAYADGAIVGSALIDAYTGLRGETAAAAAGAYARSLAAALRTP